MNIDKHISINKYMVLFRPSPEMTCTVVHFSSAFITVKQCCTHFVVTSRFTIIKDKSQESQDMIVINSHNNYLAPKLNRKQPDDNLLLPSPNLFFTFE